MKKTITILGLLFSITATINAQYYTGFDTPTEKQGWNYHQLGVSGTYGPWEIVNPGGNDYLFHDYNNVGIVEDWYVSPAINFSGPSIITFKIDPFAMNGTPGGMDYIGIWYSSNSSNPSSGDFTEVKNVTSKTNGTHSWQIETANIPSATGVGYFAFKYIDKDDWFTIKIDSITLTNAVLSSVSKSNDIKNLSIYPNPSNEFISISTTDIIKSVKIYDVAGILVENVTNNFNKIDLSEVTKGIYFFKVETENSLTTKKIIVN